MDWSLRACGRRGHLTYRPTETDLADRLTAQTAVGQVWRCLRCGDFTVGEPKLTGPAEDAPIVLRGAALRDAVILRLLSAERAIRGVLLLLAAYGVFEFRTVKGSLQQAFEHYLPLVKPLADEIGYDLTNAGPVRLIDEAFSVSANALLLIAGGIVLYGALQLTEAVGLWLLKRWGEYVAVVGTSLFIPLEVYELVEKVTVIRIGALLINIAAVIYLVWTKRLFGARGGRAAHEAHLHSESVLEVEQAALQRATPA
ncbi:DUF2127 domain-containing protein [Fodinicola acaciae]|uniref:DUF2127 domain-containing protein n=1 Tax=Fodinicola acaciae TaxID=2681555 RepID=UPI0013D6895D|nr:DUF2127 domain-containing protein [Fodinicola acaciae]